MTGRRVEPAGVLPYGFLFAPASCYPHPKAFVVDRSGAIVHLWGHSAEQPSAADDPPSYLRGWNHVEVDADGSLFAVVPLRALLKLDASSELLWSCEVAAHHDLAIDPAGGVHVLSEAPRRVEVGDVGSTILDNLVTSIDASGAITGEVSLYDLLRTDAALRVGIDETIARKREGFAHCGWPASMAVPPQVVEETRFILETAEEVGDRRRTLRRLRDLPGSPCDAMHTNTLELLDERGQGFGPGCALVCMRELHTIAIVDLIHRSVRWWWGPRELSGPHQPSLLPDGNILVYDNGAGFERTRLLVVNPATRETVWAWTASPPESFFCPLAGGCERLANGHLLVTNSTAGAAFELD